MQLRPGFKCKVRTAGNVWHRAEVVSVKDTGEVYVHFDGFNKRLDEWVDENRIDWDSIEIPPPPAPAVPPPPKQYKPLTADTPAASSRKRKIPFLPKTNKTHSKKLLKKHHSTALFHNQLKCSQKKRKSKSSEHRDQ